MAHVPTLRLAQEAAADELLGRDPFALVLGMMLDQQFPMERAFAGPRLLLDRIAGPDAERFDPAALAALDAGELEAAMTGPPAVHRYPRAMAARAQALARAVVDDHGGDAAALWTGATDGADLRRRLEALPGYGRQKASILVALLGKQLDVRPDGWREAAGDYGEPESQRSVADVRDPQSLAAVRETKRALKAARKQ